MRGSLPPLTCLLRLLLVALLDSVGANCVQPRQCSCDSATLASSTWRAHRVSRRTSASLDAGQLETSLLEEAQAAAQDLIDNGTFSSQRPAQAKAGLEWIGVLLQGGAGTQKPRFLTQPASF